MESSAFEAVLTGVSLFIFITALTIALSLISTINQISEAANSIMTQSSNSLLYEQYANNYERTVKAKDIITYKSKIGDRYQITVDAVDISTFLNTLTIDKLNEEYLLNLIDERHIQFVKK